MVVLLIALVGLDGYADRGFWPRMLQHVLLLTAAAPLLVLVAAICEGVQLFDPGFSPIHGGGYGAVFVGFTAGFTVHLLGAAYWLETIAADRTTQVGLRLRELRAALVFVTFLAAVAVIATILFYLV